MLIKSIFILVLFISLFVLPAQNKEVAVYQAIKLAEFTLLAIFFIKSKQKLKTLLLPLFAGIFFQSLIAQAQWLKQESLGGLFYWFGERTFTAGTPGIALVDLFGTLFLRPYATTPHPNVLGGFLSLTLTIVAYISLISKRRLKILIPLYLLGLLALFLTFSISAIATHCLGLLGIIFFKGKRKISLLFIFVILLSGILIFTKWQSPQTREDQKIRSELNTISLQMFLESPIIGKGLYNFIPGLPQYSHNIYALRWQPVHNIYLLILSETGIIGAGVALFLIVRILKIYQKVDRRSYKWIGGILLLQILIIGLADHYFLTLQQGQIMTTLVFSLAFLPENAYTE